MGRGYARRYGTAACLLAALALSAGAGCTSANSPAARTASPGQAAASVTPASSQAPAVAAPALPGQALASPGCSAATAAGRPLGQADTTSVTAGRSPFGVAATPDGRWAFATTLGGPAGATASVEVLRLSVAKGVGSGPAVTVVRSVSLPSSSALSGPAGAAVTPDGRYLLVADGSGAVVLSVARAEAGTAGAVLGVLAAPRQTGGPPGGAIEVAVSPDSRFAFVTLEYDDEAVVFNLGTALARGFGGGAYVGAIPLGNAAVGMAVSPDGRWLYATSEGAVARQHPVALGSAGCAGHVPGAVPGEPPGTLTVVDLRRAESDPAQSVTATVDAGYQPVRVVTAADGTEVWVTARASDDVLCFSAARLAADPAHALVAVTRVGSEPVGLAAVRGGTLIVVADSNRFGATGQNSTLSVVDASAALAGRAAIVGDLPAGGFPRDMALSPGGTLLVSDYASGQVQGIATADLPATAPG
jgi:DNA-binding beta-propeller fold protein YncE